MKEKLEVMVDKSLIDAHIMNMSNMAEENQEVNTYCSFQVVKAIKKVAQGKAKMNNLG